MKKRILLLGCGSMAQALFVNGDQRQFSFYTFTPNGESAKRLAKDIVAQGGEAHAVEENGLLLLEDLSLIVLAMKPQQLPSALPLIQKILAKNSKALVLSLLAAVSAPFLQDLLLTNRIVRCMPNTPSRVGFGVMLLYAVIALNEKDRKIVQDLFTSRSSVLWFDREEQLELAMPFSGSGPAYIFELARIFERMLVEKGFEQSMARILVGQTFRGASELLRQSTLSAEELRQQVTSKKGVTLAALEVFEKNDLEKICQKAIDAALMRSKEISKELQQSLKN